MVQLGIFSNPGNAFEKEQTRNCVYEVCQRAKFTGFSVWVVVFNLNKQKVNDFDSCLWSLAQSNAGKTYTILKEEI